MSIINNFIFDWSGTLSDDRLPLHYAKQLLCAVFGETVPSFERWIRDIPGTVEQGLSRYGIPVDGDNLRFAFDLYRHYYGLAAMQGVLPTVYPQSEEVLASLRDRGKRLFLLSSHPEKMLVDEARRYGLYDFFERAVGSCLDKASGLRQMCFSFGLDPARTMYVGDTDTDIRSAHDAGLYSAVVGHGYQPMEKLLEEDPYFPSDYLDGLLVLF